MIISQKMIEEMLEACMLNSRWFVLCISTVLLCAVIIHYHHSTLLLQQKCSREVFPHLAKTKSGPKIKGREKTKRRALQKFKDRKICTTYKIISMLFNNNTEPQKFGVFVLILRPLQAPI